MPNTVAFISVRALRAGPVLLLPPRPLFQVRKAESTLNKQRICLLIASALAFLVIFLVTRMYKISFLGKCILMSMRRLMQVNHLSRGESVGSQKWHEPGVHCLMYSLVQSWGENTKRPCTQWSKLIISLMVGFAWFCCIVTCLLKLQNVPLNFIHHFLTDIVLKMFVFLQIEALNLSYMPLVKKELCTDSLSGPRI